MLIDHHGDGPSQYKFYTPIHPTPCQVTIPDVLKSPACRTLVLHAVPPPPLNHHSGSSTTLKMSLKGFPLERACMCYRYRYSGNFFADQYASDLYNVAGVSSFELRRTFHRAYHRPTSACRIVLNNILSRLCRVTIVILSQRLHHSSSVIPALLIVTYHKFRFSPPLWIM